MLAQVETYVHNTHAKTHDAYTLEVLDVFSAAREGEDARFAPFSTLDNRRLLWHGSRLSNWVGILSQVRRAAPRACVQCARNDATCPPQGLRIAPPEAPVTGYMFGKGVYFAVRHAGGGAAGLLRRPSRRADASCV